MKYFPKLNKSQIDVVIVTYPDLLDDLKNLKDDINVKKRALWLLNDNGKRIYKELGSHTDITLDDILLPSKGIPLPSHYPSIINFSRDSNKDHIAAEGLLRLLPYAISYSDFDFTIEKIDKILSGGIEGIQTHMPLLWQMNPEERFSRWRHMVGIAIENKWMREAHPNLYHFLNIHTSKDLDDNVTKQSLGTMIRRIKETCGLHGQ